MNIWIVYCSGHLETAIAGTKYFFSKSKAMQYLYLKRMEGIGDWCWKEVKTEDVVEGT